jgi:hypothetical protein
LCGSLIQAWASTPVAFLSDILQCFFPPLRNRKPRWRNADNVNGIDTSLRCRAAMAVGLCVIIAGC